jgi:tol-pal system protein YbgF
MSQRLSRNDQPVEVYRGQHWLPLFAMALAATSAEGAMDQEARLQISRYQGHLVQVQNQVRTLELWRESMQSESSAIKARYDGLHEVQRDLHTRFLTLHEEQDPLTSEWATLQSEQQELASRLSSVVAQVEAMTEGQQPGMKVAQAEPTTSRAMVQLLNQMDTLNAELNKLRGKMEELGHGVSSAEKRQRDMYLDLDTRMRRIEQQVVAAQKKDQEMAATLEERLRKLEQQSGQAHAIPAPVSSAAASDAPAAPTTGGQPASTSATGSNPLPPATLSGSESPQRTYDIAMSSYRVNDYQGAINGFLGFLKQYPQHNLAANAQYWIGDAFFQLRDYKSALEAQRKLLAAYPDSGKIPDALLNMGSAELGLGDAAAARKTWEELIAKHSGTEAAEKARQRLSRLR